mmetsp:Transcript_2343/g.5078  ORF Transcript_2343/g.5078 Transcript_2343/m.5078 type:complete len:84 (-) Transcript_2343:924-1175(-)
MGYKSPLVSDGSEDTEICYHIKMHWKLAFLLFLILELPTPPPPVLLCSVIFYIIAKQNVLSPSPSTNPTPQAKRIKGTINTFS